MILKFSIRTILIALASVFPKFKVGYGYFFIILMNLVAIFFMVAATLDYDTQPWSVVRFEIILGVLSCAIGWFLGLKLINQTKRHEEIMERNLDKLYK